MFGGYYYFPDLKISPSEIEALERLPGTDRDKLLPIIKLRRWLGSEKLENSIKQIDRAMGKERPCIVDIVPPEKEDSEAERDLNKMLNPANGYAHWVDFVEADDRFVPVLQVSGEKFQEIVNQANALIALERGLVVRLRRSNGWDLVLLNWLKQVNFADVPLLVILDYGQMPRTADINVIAATLTGLAQTCVQIFDGADLHLTITASSFPSNFAEINRETARLDIFERQLFRSVATALDGQAAIRYGDYASVYAGERGFARGGAPRIDLPKQTRWVYHRKEVGGYVDAAVAVVKDDDWDDDLVIWGTERIRDAAAGNLGKLTHPRAWTAVRIHLHLHQQIHYGGSPGELNDTDEEWKD